MRLTLAAVALTGLAACNDMVADRPQPDQPPAATEGLPMGVGFDFYVLALSWSPSYCEAEGESANEQQCGSTRPHGFIVHGLWPQFERGLPENCLTDVPEVPKNLLADLRDLTPSDALIRHQWRKHGSCSGLSQQDYFTVMRAARKQVTVPERYQNLDKALNVAPPALEKEFIGGNAGLDPDEIAVSCDRSHVRDVRICMTKQLEFRSCPEVDERGCRLSKAVMPPVRG